MNTEASNIGNTIPGYLNRMWNTVSLLKSVLFLKLDSEMYLNFMVIKIWIFFSIKPKYLAAIKREVQFACASDASVVFFPSVI